MVSPLLTDFYQLTMAFGYWQQRMHEQEAVFHLTFRNNPFQGQYAITCGLDAIIDFLQQWQLTDDDLTYLAGLKQADQPYFTHAFLDYLRQLRICCDIDAIPEGTVVFPGQPLLRVKGPLLQGQLLESTLLNIINFQTLIATKASRICLAAQGDPVFDFGMRRAQGPDGALSASRAAYIGGCSATSNVLAGKIYNIPVKGTHGHSWVIAFPSELEAFSAYAETMPQNGILLVDTYNTLQGIHHAIEIGKQLRKKGSDLHGIRLDSGDLESLSVAARALLDAAGFTQTQIIASNLLDEKMITYLKKRNSPISQWGVGTHLITAFDQPALEGVYKLSALRDKHGVWQSKLKVSEQIAKTSMPGIHQVRRYTTNGAASGDVLYDETLGFDNPVAQKQQACQSFSDLLVPVFKQGKLVYARPTIDQIRDHAHRQVVTFSNIFSVGAYPTSVAKNLLRCQQKLVTAANRDLAC